MKKRHFAVILAGAGKMDGNDLHEAVLLLAAIAQNGATYQCFAPDMEQHHVVDHISGAEMPDRRNVLREAARIARGDIKPLDQYDANDFDGLLFPGGFGVAKNLCTYALAGTKATVNPLVEKAITTTHGLKKPIGALCIAPILLALTLKRGTITLGDDNDSAKDAVALGMKHEVKTTHEIAIDEENHLYTTPCYMLEASIADIAVGINQLIRAIVDSLK